jgi:Mg/Co/Ni transporter MgtE
MSPRAAWRLEALGFEAVYDYAAGKLDWLAAGLPSEGALASEPRAGSLARRDAPTCRLDAAMHEAREAATGWHNCYVVNEHGILMGRLGSRALADANGRIEDAMTEGPSTIRPNAPAAKVLERMRARDVSALPVTTSDGRFIGAVVRDDLERFANRIAKHP